MARLICYVPETEANEWPVVDERMLAAEVAWSVDVVDLVFMPIGLDGHAWAYRVETSDGRRYFLKVRRGDFTPAAVLLPGFLRAQGLREVVAPLGPSPRWRGRTSVRGLSTTALPVPRRRRPVGRAARSDALNAFWERYGTALHRLAETVDDLASRVTPGQRVICHADIHRGNLIVDGDDPLHVVDWDAPILAPCERDLVFVHSADFGDHPINTRRAELFREGYGALEPDPVLLSYYRDERHLDDVAAFLGSILGPESRANDLHWLTRIAEAVADAGYAP